MQNKRINHQIFSEANLLGVDSVIYRMVKPSEKPHSKRLAYMAGKGIDSIFIGVGDCFGDFEIDCCDRNPMIYTEKSRPKKGDLTFIKGQIVHMIDIRGDDEFFSKWVIEAVNAKPKLLTAIDSVGEVFVWNK